MNSSIYTQFLNNNGTILDTLEKSKVFFVTGLAQGGLLRDESLLDFNSGCFEEDDLQILEKLINSSFFKEYTLPVIIDAVKAVSLYKKSDASLSEREKSSLRLSRFSFMGTDGMRGKVALESDKDCIKSFLSDNLLMPEMIKLASYSFTRMLIDAGTAKKSEIACVGNDGRDLTTGWKLNEAMIHGFYAAGLDVMDIGIAPTPFVPYQMLKKGFTCGAVLTASHNPANQNGIKFFLDGKKLLPEGEFGDYTMAAWMYASFLEGVSSETTGKSIDPPAAHESKDLVLSVVPDNLPELLKDSFIVLDNANGAFADLSIQVLDELKIDYVCINDKPTGKNINQACGVAEVEGQEEFLAAGYDSYLKIIKEVFDKGRSESRQVFGIVLDGDGDRGFVLYYDKQKDAVYVVDGDKSGYILAEYYIKTRSMNAGDYTFVSTVESDIMTAYYAGQTLGLKTKIVSVGDKWICTFDEGKLILGLESSGHLIFPIEFKSDAGKDVALRAGNGMLTALMTLAGIKELNLSPSRIVEPYEAGFSKTFYTYFVDKSLFYRDSNVWNSDKKIIEEEIARIKQSGSLSSSVQLIFEDKEDANMLYASLMDGDSLLAAIFCRNSGTEDKTAVYVKCKQELESVLLPVGVKLKDNHLSTMKNVNRIEYKYETEILKELEAKKELSISELKTILDGKFTEPISDTDLYGVIYGLKKEGRASFENDVVKI